MVAVQGTILVSFIQHFLSCLPVFICTTDSLILHSWNSLCRPAFLFLLRSELSCIPDSTSVWAVLHSWFHFSQSCPAFLFPLQPELFCTPVELSWMPFSATVWVVLHSSPAFFFLVHFSQSCPASLIPYFHFSQSCPEFLFPHQSELFCTPVELSWIPFSATVRVVRHNSQGCPAQKSELSCAAVELS
jgi:hypothetical protein